MKKLIVAFVTMMSLSACVGSIEQYPVVQPHVLCTKQIYGHADLYRSHDITVRATEYVYGC